MVIADYWLYSLLRTLGMSRVVPSSSVNLLPSVSESSVMYLNLVLCEVFSLNVYLLFAGGTEYP